MEPPTPPLETLMRPGFPVPIRLRNEIPIFSSPASRSLADPVSTFQSVDVLDLITWLRLASDALGSGIGPA